MVGNGTLTVASLNSDYYIDRPGRLGAQGCEKRYSDILGQTDCNFVICVSVIDGKVDRSRHVPIHLSTVCEFPVDVDRFTSAFA
jgi:hypothetical protein